ncbi:hypothetical protein Ddc_23733 [Ditylenchus destructor]|nr:hypothetical protein Ddc_23733 [Ditylenchus destructor]
MLMFYAIVPPLYEKPEVTSRCHYVYCQYHTSMLLTIKIHSNFTVFAKFHDNEWHSLMWFDYQKWSKSYIPGNCSYEEQVLDGVVHPFAICMRRNVTEKFYKNITQGDQTSSTLRITTDYAETSESVAPILLDQEDIEEGISRIAQMSNITEEMVNNVLSTLDIFLNSTKNGQHSNFSRILQSLNSIVKNSCCDIDFIGDWSLVVRRHTVSCLETDPNEWPILNEIPKKSNFGFYELNTKNHVSIEIPYKTVCSERINHGGSIYSLDLYTVTFIIYKFEFILTVVGPLREIRV